MKTFQTTSDVMAVASVGRPCSLRCSPFPAPPEGGEKEHAEARLIGRFPLRASKQPKQQGVAGSHPPPARPAALGGSQREIAAEATPSGNRCLVLDRRKRHGQRSGHVTSQVVENRRRRLCQAAGWSSGDALEILRARRRRTALLALEHEAEAVAGQFAQIAGLEYDDGETETELFMDGPRIIMPPRARLWRGYASSY